MSRSRAAFLALMAVVGMAASSCESKDEAAVPADPQKALVARGRAVYQSVCIACHNTDPKKAGSLGPELHGASLELIKARVMSAGYPAGYTPKRATHVMQALPQVAKDLPAIHAYLNQ